MNETQRNKEKRAASVFLDLAEPIELIAIVHDKSIRRKWKPGEAFQKLPDDVKELLKNLKSDDIAKTRYVPFGEPFSP